MNNRKETKRIKRQLRKGDMWTRTKFREETEDKVAALQEVLEVKGPNPKIQAEIDELTGLLRYQSKNNLEW
jgi:hypothetical protein